LGWKDLKIPWSILLMFGGGLALGNTLFVSGVAQYLVDLLPQFPTNFMLIILIISAISNYATEVIPNTAFVSTFVPIFVILTKSTGLNPLFIILTVGVCGSMAFTLPIGTLPSPSKCYSIQDQIFPCFRDDKDWNFFRDNITNFMGIICVLAEKFLYITKFTLIIF
jgi:hypothetical protein